MLGSLVAVALNSTIAIMDDNITWRALNMALKVSVQNRTSLNEAMFIPAAFNAYSENLRNSGATKYENYSVEDYTCNHPGGDSNQKRSRNGFCSLLSFVKSYS